MQSLRFNSDDIGSETDMIRDSRLRTELLRFVYGRERWPTLGHRWSPATDVFQSDGTLIVRLEIGGMAIEDFDIRLDLQRLLIRGERHDDRPKLAYFHMAIPFGRFSTEIELPGELEYDADRIGAVYENGFLTVEIPIAAPQGDEADVS